MNPHIIQQIHTLFSFESYYADLYIETEQDHIAIFDHIIFSLQANQALLLRLCVSTAV